MWTRKLLKDNALVAFRRNYWSCVAVSLIVAVLCGTLSEFQMDVDFEEMMYHSPFVGFYASRIFTFIASVIVIVALCVQILVTNVIKVGGCRYYMENREHKTSVAQVFYGFCDGRYGNNIWIMFLKEVYIFAWSLLFVIPGIVKSYSYMMIPYILAENPDISRERAFQISNQMMDGHKMEAFTLDLSFIGWNLLSLISFGIGGIFYVNPYIDATHTEFYTAIKSEAFEKGITNPVELPGVRYPEYTEQFTQGF